MCVCVCKPQKSAYWAWFLTAREIKVSLYLPNTLFRFAGGVMEIRCWCFNLPIYVWERVGDKKGNRPLSQGEKSEHKSWRYSHSLLPFMGITSHSSLSHCSSQRGREKEKKSKKSFLTSLAVECFLWGKMFLRGWGRLWDLHFFFRVCYFHWAQQLADRQQYNSISYSR